MRKEEVFGVIRWRAHILLDTALKTYANKRDKDRHGLHKKLIESIKRDFYAANYLTDTSGYQDAGVTHQEIIEYSAIQYSRIINEFIEEVRIMDEGESNGPYES